MIERINNFLSPAESLIRKYQKYIGYFFLLLAFASFFFLYDKNSIKESGEKAITVLWIILWMPIFARVFGLRIVQAMMPLRKELGILMGVLAFVHSSRFFLNNQIEFLFQSAFWLNNGFLSFLAFGFFAFALTVPLTLTSSRWAMKKMGKYWKYLHRTVYVIIIFTVAHVVLLQMFKGFEIAPVALLGVYFGCKVLEWKGVRFGVSAQSAGYPKGQKWICIPCGYIYDPLIGDEDSGIAPGTEFTDIPDSWSCPDCGVSKSDFIVYTPSSEQNKGYDATVISKTFLNPTTLELVIEILEKWESKPGQFMTFLWSDTAGSFSRSYSIVKQEGTRFTFTIKLGEMGRGATLLKNLTPNQHIRVGGIFGRFLLQDTQYPKYFIATGTGLAPIYNMITTLLEHPDASRPQPKVVLYFTVATREELFYGEKLRNIPNLDLHIHISREQVDGYAYGRVDVDTIEASSDTEWYLCGNPKMVSEAREKLMAKGFQTVYTEAF